MFLAMGPQPYNKIGLLSGGIFRELPMSALVKDTVERQGALVLYVDQTTWDFWVAATKTQLGA